MPVNARFAAALVLAGLALAPAPGAAAPAPPIAGPPTSVGRGGAAASIDRPATRAAIDILRRGGNAVDAAVAAAAVLSVTEPFSCGIGGGGYMLMYDARARKVSTIDHRETAPAAIGPDAFIENGKVLPFNDARYSGRSVGVPGTIRGWATALRRDGTISLAQALKSAIRVARDGFIVDQTFFNQVNANADYFDDVPATAALFLDPDGTPRDVGTTLRQPDLARTLELIAAKGTRAFYRGKVANAIVETVRRPPIAPTANHVWRAGVMRNADLHGYDPVRRAPTLMRYRGLDLYGQAPSSSGGSTVGEALNILEGFPLGSLPREQAIHLRLEASRLAFADRGAYLADPMYFVVPLRGLLSDGFAATRRALIGERAATSPVPPGDPYPFNGSGSAGGSRAATFSGTRAGSTTHLSVSDRTGNIVSYTFTVESTGGSGLVVPGYGILLNNELTDFTIDSVTHPNRVQPGKRPRSAISPTIVFRKGKPWFTVGTPGGSTIIATVLQLLTDRIDLGMTLPQAIAAPRVQQRNNPNLDVEPAFLQTPEAALLRARGHTFGTPVEIGAASGIEFRGDGSVIVAAEPVRRGGGSAMVVRPAP